MYSPNHLIIYEICISDLMHLWKSEYNSIKRKCKCNLYFKSVYQLQETRATKALGRLEKGKFVSSFFYFLPVRKIINTTYSSLLLPTWLNCLLGNWCRCIKWVVMHAILPYDWMRDRDPPQDLGFFMPSSVIATYLLTHTGIQHLPGQRIFWKWRQHWKYNDRIIM